MIPERRLIEHDYYPLDVQADMEYDELREEGYRTAFEKQIVEEMEEKARMGY